MVEVLGSSTLLFPSSFVYCRIYVFTLCVTVVIKTGTCVEIYLWVLLCMCFDFLLYVEAACLHRAVLDLSSMLWELKMQNICRKKIMEIDLYQQFSS